ARRGAPRPPTPRGRLHRAERSRARRARGGLPADPRRRRPPVRHPHAVHRGVASGARQRGSRHRAHASAAHVSAPRRRQAQVPRRIRGRHGRLGRRDPARGGRRTTPGGHRMTNATELFTQLTGSAPERVWSAPGRANLIGEHTDYNEGYVLPFAIEHRTHAAVGRRRDGIIRVASTFDPNPVEVAIVATPALAGGDPGEDAQSGDVPEWAAYPLGVAWAALAHVDATHAQIPGVDIALASDVPIGAGLSSSAAIEGATVGALDDLWHLGLTPLDMSQIGRTAENLV